jgi:hypothetical protein
MTAGFYFAGASFACAGLFVPAFYVTIISTVI